MAFIYLIGELDNNKNYKIGVTKKKNIDERKNELQTGSSQELYVNTIFETKYPYKLEKMLHRHFHNKKIINEWFELDSDEVKNFKDTCQKYTNILESLKTNPFFNKQKE